MFGGTARELLQSQNNMSLESTLKNNVQVKIQFTKNLEYLYNERSEANKYYQRPILVRVFPLRDKIKPKDKEIGLMKK